MFLFQAKGAVFIQRIRFVNRLGQSVDLYDEPPYIFWKIDGLGIGSVTTANTQSIGQHGYSVHEILLEARKVNITGHIAGVDGAGKPFDSDERLKRLYEFRQRLNNVLNPALGVGELYYENDYGSYMIPAFCDGLPYEARVGAYQTVSMSFECPSPYWLTAEQGIVKLGYAEGGLEFPVVTPAYFGILGYMVDIDNDGGTVTPLEFTIEGGMINPVVKNLTTGQFIKLSRQIYEGEKIYINTDPENTAIKLITIDPVTNKPAEKNAYGYLTDDSEPFSLVPGRNVIIFKSDDEENKKVTIWIKFRKRYAGV